MKKEIIMKFQTLSVVAGTKHCDASCPFCVSGMTGLDIAGAKPIDINQRNLKKTLQIAEMGNVSTAIITGKGEPTLFPDHVTEYLQWFNGAFPFVELQTNGVRIAKGYLDKYLQLWYDLGLTTILISNVGYDQELNRQTYMPKTEKYYSHEELIKKLHDVGFLVRMTCVGIKDGVEDVETFKKYLDYCEFIGADQVTWRPVSKPDSRENTENPEIWDWTVDNGVCVIDAEEVKEWVHAHGILIRRLSHGGAVYDLGGQNVCMTDCLTHDPDEEELRQLIFFPNGELYTDWQFKGSRIL
jgi:MoaA/NifB/PqqE/SkfB family radical SAM enzyme